MVRGSWPATADRTVPARAWSSSPWMLVGATVILHAAGFGRYVYTLGSNIQVARFSGVRISRVRLTIFTASSLVAALAGRAAGGPARRRARQHGRRLRARHHHHRPLGGVSIFGGRGTMFGVFLSILLILNLRNGLGHRERDRQHPDRRDRRPSDPVGADPEPRRAGPIALRAGRRRSGDVTGDDPGGAATCRMSWLAYHPRPRVEEETP